MEGFCGGGVGAGIPARSASGRRVRDVFVARSCSSVGRVGPRGRLEVRL